MRRRIWFLHIVWQLQVLLLPLPVPFFGFEFSFAYFNSLFLVLDTIVSFSYFKTLVSPHFPYKS